MGDADLSEIEIVSDGDGIALIGSSSSIETVSYTHLTLPTTPYV